MSLDLWFLGVLWGFGVIGFWRFGVLGFKICFYIFFVNLQRCLDETLVFVKKKSLHLNCIHFVFFFK